MAYGPLSVAYRERMHKAAPEAAYAFYRRYAEAAKGPILVAMCGTGRFLAPLLAAGFSIEGVESSEKRLERLKSKCLAKKLEAPKVYQQRLPELYLPHYYNLIFIPQIEFGYISDLDEAAEALKRLHSHLKPAGKLVFDFGTPHFNPGQPQGTWVGEIAALENDSQILLKSLLLAKEPQLGQFINEYQHIQEGKVVQVEVEQLELRLYTITAMMEQLKAAGFEEQRFFKAYNAGQLAGSADGLVVCEATRSLENSV